MANELNIDTQFLRNLEQANAHLKGIVRSTKEATDAFKQLATDSSAADVMAKIQAGLAKISGKKVEVNIEAKGLEELTSGMSDVIGLVKILQSAELFDVQKIYATQQNLFQAEDALSSIKKKIKDLREEWHLFNNDKLTVSDIPENYPRGAFFAPKHKDGREYKEKSTTYQKAFEHYKQTIQQQIELELKLEIEKQAIAKKGLQWAKMTMAERAEYIQKELNKILKEEQRKINEVRKLYSGYLSEMNSLSSKINKNESKNADGALDEQIRIQKDRYMQLDALRRELEEDYGAHIVDIAEKANARAADITAARLRKEADAKKAAEQEALEKYRSSAVGSLKLASEASTINEMKEAQKYLQIARGNVDVKDTETIQKLNEEYTRLRMTIESLTTAEKNEQALQPTLKNEYSRLLVELDKIAEAKERASKTQAFKEGSQAAQQEMNALIERENDIREKMAVIEKAAVIKSKERVKLEKELADWTAERDRLLKNTNARDVRDAKKGRGTQEAKDFLFADSHVAELQAKLNAVEENESALDDIIRKHEANRAMASIALTEKTEAQKAEIAHRILKEKLAESLKYGSISSHSANRMIDITDNSQNIAEEERAIKKLEEARKNLNKNDDDYYETLERLNKKIDEHTHKIKVATDAQYRENQEKEYARKQNTTFHGAMDYSKNTKSINGQIQAIKYLKEARANLNKGYWGDKEYARQVSAITEEIKRQQDAVDELEGKTKQTNGALENLSRRLIAAFSINAIQNYISKLVEVRGEFALQQKALSAIVQDQRAANQLWGKTVALAVKSPFRVKQLVTYTKELAAYRVETGKLYDTTKMLADISAGLGVDMQRLILAYGQVKAANYLRGTELRQFSEAGINILGELSTYFEEIEGRAVSVAEVFDMVSKRAVKFEDVHAVLQRMTESGGIFFEMQEKQAETVQGQISNLRDAYELMLNDIGKANEGYIISGIRIMRLLISNWETLSAIAVPTLSAIAVGMTAWKVQTLVTSAAFHTFVSSATKTFKSFLILITQGKNAMNAFAASAAINPFGAWAIAIGIGITALAKFVQSWYEYNKAIERVNKQHDEAIKQIRNLHAEFVLASKEDGAYEKQIDALNRMVALANSKYHMEIKVDVKEATQEEIATLINDITKKTLEAEAFISEFKKAFVKRNDVRFNPFGDEIAEDIKDFQNEMSDFDSFIINQRKSLISNLYDNLESLTESQKKAYEEISKEYDSKTESEAQYIERLRLAYKKLYKETHEAWVGANIQDAMSLADDFLNKTGVRLTTLADYFKDYEESAEEAKEEVYKLFKLIKGLEGLKNEEKETLLRIAIDELALQNEWNDKVVLNIKKWAEDFYSEPGLRLQIQVPLKPGETPPLLAWQKAYNDKFAGKFGYKEIKDSDEGRDEVIKRLQENWADTKKLIEAINKAQKKGLNPLGEGGLYQGEDLGKLQTQLQDLEDQLDSFGAEYSKKKKGGESKDWFSEMAKSIRDTHKDFVTLHQDLDKTEALEEAIKKNEDAFLEAANQAGLNLTLRDFVNLDSEGGAIGALLDFLDYIPERAKNARLNVNKSIGDLTSENTVNSAKRFFDELSSSFENMFGEYELTINLKEAGFNSDWIESFFNVPNTTLEDIRAKIRSTLGAAAQEIEDDASLKEAIQNSSLQKNVQKELIKNLEKVSEEERKALQKRLEQYLEYSKKSLTAVSQIRLKEAQELQSVNETISAEIERVGKDTEKGKKLAEVLDTLKKSIKDTADRDVISAEWDEFKGSEMFLQFFEDAEFATTNAINNMLEQLEYFRQGLAQEGDVELMRTVVKEMEKLEKIKLERAPFMAIINAFKDRKDFRDKRSDYKLSGLDIYGVENKSGFKSNKDIDNSIGQIDDAIEGLRKKYQEAIASGDTVVATSLDDDIKKLKEGKEGLEKLKSEGEDAGKTLRESFGEFGGKLTEIGQSLPQFQAAFENMGFGFSQRMKDAIATTSEVLTGVGSAIQGFATGNYLQGILGIAQALGSLFQIGNKKRERQIQSELKTVEKLSKAYEELERHIEKAYSVDTLKTSYDGAQNALNSQIASYEKMIALEEGKKNGDAERIDEWKDAIKELESQQEELKQEQVEAMGGGYDFRSITRDFVNAWIDAFNETGVGLDGLDEKFKELMKNVAVEQAVMRGASTILKPLLDEINASLEDDFKVDTDELANIESLNQDARLRLDEFLKSLFGEGGVFSDYISTDAETGELSGLQRGIQGVTEETAHIIEGYLNSIRFFVAEKYRVLSEFVSSFSNPEMENPLVAQLRIIAIQTSNIHNLLNSLTAPHPTLDGIGLKVVI